MRLSHPRQVAAPAQRAVTDALPRHRTALGIKRQPLVTRACDELFDPVKGARLHQQPDFPAPAGKHPLDPFGGARQAIEARTPRAPDNALQAVRRAAKLDAGRNGVSEIHGRAADDGAWSWSHDDEAN
jgi:hypothetical protein